MRAARLCGGALVALRGALAGLAAWVALSVAGAALAAPGFRAKIDAVDAREAPTVRLLLTFLDPQGQPVNPRLVDLVEVRIDGERVDPDDVEMDIWREVGYGTDLVVIYPGTQGLNEATLKALGETLEDATKALTADDQMALVTYGRAVNVDAPLDKDKSKPKQTFEKIEFKGVRPFMFSALDKAVSMLETSAPDRKRAILYVGDGTDAGAIGVDELNKKIRETVDRARAADIKIWTVGYSPEPLADTSARTLSLLSRKTGATTRQALTQRDLKNATSAVLGEIVGQIVLMVDGDFEEGQAYDFQVRIQAEASPEVDTPVFKAPIEQVAFDWIFWGIFGGVTCLLSGLGLVLTVVGVTWWRRRKARQEAEELLAELLVDRPETCETCHRVQRPDWEECPFCAQGMDPLDDAQREAPFVYDEEDRKLCNVCGRVCRPEWQACAFCAQGMEPLPEWVALKEEEAMLMGKVDPEKMAEKMRQEQEAQAAAANAAAQAAAAEAAERQSKMAAGGTECATCGRIMEPGWPECLFCASGLPPLK